MRSKFHLKDLRAVWSEDQYEILGYDRDCQNFYFGRRKQQQYLVYIRYPNTRHRRLVQQVRLDQDWYWCDQKFQLIGKKPTHAESALKRNEHVIKGFRWGLKTQTKKIEDLSGLATERGFVLPCGAEAIVLQTRKSKKWILSLHGGPESYEGTEIRYGGMYRDLLRSGISVVILNYRGSVPLKRKVSNQVWGRWSKSIQEDYLELSVLVQNLDLNSSPAALLGGSFGGALALILQKYFLIPSCVLSSPLLDLHHQMKRASLSERVWFNRRFSQKDFEDFSFQSLCRRTYGKKTILYSLNDEVLGKQMYEKLEDINDSRWTLKKDTCAHVPKSYREFQIRFGGLFETLMRACAN